MSAFTFRHKLERLSLPVILLHRGIEEIALVHFLPVGERDLPQMIYEVPALLAWSCLTPVVLLWVGRPFHLLLERLLNLASSLVHNRKTVPQWQRQFAGLILIAIACTCAMLVYERTCFMENQT